MRGSKSASGERLLRFAKKQAPITLFLVLILPLWSAPVIAASRWLSEDSAFRVTLTASAGPYSREDDLVVAPLPVSGLLSSAKAGGFLDVSSLKLFEIKAGAVEVPCDYTAGKLFFNLAGQTAPLAKRTYHLYFNLTKARPAVTERRGAILKPGEVLPGDNLVPNPSFEEQVEDSSGAVLSVEDIDRIYQTNLVPDGGLEKEGWELPVAEAPLEIKFEKGAGRDNSTGLVIEAQGAGQTQEYKIISPVFEVKPNTFYKFSLWQWLDKNPPTGLVRIKLIFLGENNKYAGNINAHPARKEAFGIWRQLSYQGWSSAYARLARVEIIYKGLSDTRCVLDDFKVTGKVFPPGWRLVYHYADAGMDMQLIGGDISDGKQVMKVSTGPRNRCTATVITKRFPVKPNTTYIGGGDIKVLEPGAKATVYFKVYDQAGKPAMDGNSAFLCGPSVGIIGTWEKVKKGALTKPNAAWGVAGISVGWGQGTVLFDNIYIKEAVSGQAVKVRVGSVERR